MYIEKELDPDSSNPTSSSHSISTPSPDSESYPTPSKFNPTPSSNKKSNATPSPDKTLSLVIGTVVTTLIVIVTVVFCFVHRRKPKRKKRDIGNYIENATFEFEGNTPLNRRLPEAPYSDNGYLKPTDIQPNRRLPEAPYSDNGYLKPVDIQSSRRLPEATYSGYLKPADIQPNRRLPETPIYSNSIYYSETAVYSELIASKRIPIDANYQCLSHNNKQGKYFCFPTNSFACMPVYT